jgi:hypothetical protein
MKYSEKVLKYLNQLIDEGKLPSVTENNNQTTVTYSKVYNEKKGKNSSTFFYKISDEAKPLFGNANKTHVIINHESDIDYKYYHEIFIPKEIVAIACGYENFKDLENSSSKLQNDEKDRIEYMISNLIPISEKEYYKI